MCDGIALNLIHWIFSFLPLKVHCFPNIKKLTASEHKIPYSELVDYVQRDNECEKKKVITLQQIYGMLTHHMCKSGNFVFQWNIMIFVKDRDVLTNEIRGNFAFTNFFLDSYIRCSVIVTRNTFTENKIISPLYTKVLHGAWWWKNFSAGTTREGWKQTCTLGKQQSISSNCHTSNETLAFGPSKSRLHSMKEHSDTPVTCQAPP